MTAPNHHHPLVLLARAAIEAYVDEGRVLSPEDAPEPVEGGRAGVFVTLWRRRSHELRGCIGTIQPTEDTLADETIRNAIAAATRDPRFPAMRREELDDLELEVSVLHPPEHISSPDELDPRRYGVIVQHGRRRGLLLPDIPGIDDAATQVYMARQKAWIGRDEPVELWRFQVDKYE